MSKNIIIILQTRRFILKLRKRKSSKQPFLLQWIFLFQQLIYKVVLLLSYFASHSILCSITTGKAKKQIFFLPENSSNNTAQEM